MVYMGGKTRIIKYLAPIINKYIKDNKATTYIEPFVGGANVIASIQCENRIGCDLNPYLIAVFNNMDKVLEIPVPISREDYQAAKESWKANDGKFEDWYVGALGFIASYSGKFFDGSYIKDTYYRNGREGHYHTEKKNNLIKQQPKIKDVVFKVQNFKDLEIENAVIYCDPPYIGTTKYPYSDYEGEAFWNKVRKLSEKNIVLVSELTAPDDFEVVWEKEIQNAIKKTASQGEKLFIRKK